MGTDIIALIRIARARGASDIHMSVGLPAMLRINGYIVTAEAPEDCQPLTDSDTHEAFDLITTDEEKAVFEREKELDFG